MKNNITVGMPSSGTKRGSSTSRWFRGGFLLAVASGTLLIGALSLDAKAGGSKDLCGGGTPGFWSSPSGLDLLQSGDLSYLNGFPLVDADGNRVHFASAGVSSASRSQAEKDFSRWLRGRTAKLMASQLSAHLAAFVLNQSHYKYDANEIAIWIYDDGTWSCTPPKGSETVAAVMTAEAVTLEAFYALSAFDPNVDNPELEADMELLKNFLDCLNNAAEARPCLN